MQYIDNIDFAKHKNKISGELNLENLERVQELFNDTSGIIHYKIEGTQNKKNAPALKVVIYGKITTLCHKCLNKLDIEVDKDEVITIFKNELELDNALFGDENQHDDGIVADSNFDIINFIEDEIIMQMPIAPKHEKCDKLEYTKENLSPFNKLKQLLN